MILISGGIYIYWTQVYPDLSISWIHTVLSILTSVSLYLSFFNVSLSDPGIIQGDNHTEYMKKWGFDYILYEPLKCKTCLFVKIPRSKHCSCCNRCIAKQDHHCIWLDNCIGYKNYYKFITFLFLNAWACSYACFLCFKGIQSVYIGYGWVNKDVWAQSKDGTRFQLSEYEKWSFVLRVFPLRGGLFLFTGMASLIIFGFLFYQLYVNLINGQTTNESFKWQEVKYYITLKKWSLLPFVVKCNQSCQSIPEIIPPEELEQSEILIKDVKELKNIYNLGWKRNWLEYAL